MKGEYVALRSLQNSDGYKILMALWALQHEKIVQSMRKAGKKNQESSWRYFAGQQEGFELALTEVDRALLAMQKEQDELEPSDATKNVEDLLKEIKGQQSN